MHKTALIIVCLTLGFTAWSQVDTSLIIQGITVQANRIQQSSEDMGRNVTIIKRSELLNAGVRSLDEAFQTLGGIEVQQRGINGVQADISLRGSTFNQVLVLIDGQPVNDPLTGHFTGNIPVNMLDVEQIEILRGPSAAIYGPDAVGGVINIVTRSHDQPKKGFELKGAYEFGDHGLSEYDLSGEIGLGRIRVGATYNDSKADGEDHLSDTTSRYFDVSTFSGFVSYSGKSLKSFWRVSSDRREFDARYYYTRSSFDRAVETVDRFWLQGNVSYDLDKDHSVVLNYSRMETDDDFIFTPASVPNTHNTVRHDARLEWQGEWSDKITSMIGFTGNIQEIQSNDRGDHDDNRLGFFGILEYMPSESWTITPALRLDKATTYDLQLNPQVAVNWNRGKWLLRGMVGRSIRAADFTERYVNFGRQDTLASGRNLGNANLVPETSWSGEIGGNYIFDKSISASATLFARESENLIDYIITPAEEIGETRLLLPDGEYFYAQNIGELSQYGIETRIDANPDLGTYTQGYGFVSYTYVNTEGNEGQISKYLSNNASHLMSWQLGVKHRFVDVSLNGLYKQRNGDLAEAIGAELSDSYHLLNARVSVDLLGDFIDLYVRVNNITDESYSDILGAQLPGRWWAAGVRMNWQ